MMLVLKRTVLYSAQTLDGNQIFERTIVNIFLTLLKRTHLDGSSKYPQHMFWLRNKKIFFGVRTLN